MVEIDKKTIDTKDVLIAEDSKKENTENESYLDYIKDGLINKTKVFWEELLDEDKRKEFKDIYGSPYVYNENYFISEYSNQVGLLNNYKTNSNNLKMEYIVCHKNFETGNLTKIYRELMFRNNCFLISIYDERIKIRFFDNRHTGDGLIYYIDFYNISKDLFENKDKLIREAESIINN